MTFRRAPYVIVVLAVVVATLISGIGGAAPFPEMPGQDAKDWYWAPVLTYAEDFPALGLGYRLPAMRIAIEILDD